MTGCLYEHILKTAARIHQNTNIFLQITQCCVVANECLVNKYVVKAPEEPDMPA